MPIAAALPGRRTLRTLETAARGCRACHLWRRATQTVFGEGAPRRSDARRRTAGQRRGPRGSSVRGTRGPDLERSARAGGDRPCANVRHQRRQALQVGAERQTTYSRQTESSRNQCVPAVARRRDRRLRPTHNRVPGSDSRQGATRAIFVSDRWSVDCAGVVRAIRARTRSDRRSSTLRRIGAGSRAGSRCRRFVRVEIAGRVERRKHSASTTSARRPTCSVERIP